MTDLNSFKQKIETYALKASSQQNERDYQNAVRTIDLLTSVREPFGRDPNFSHITASAWVMNESRSALILTHHKKLDTWLQVGGHCDGDPCPERVALKEANEETGLKSIRQMSTEPVDIDIHLVPANAKEPAHYHYDVRYILLADENEPLGMSDESNDLRWVRFSELDLFTNRPSVLIAREKRGL
ncbi:8-oxo-dGTP pyrophosphatase MutT (NUDIX family) [Rhizobium leguminosarum]|uniref:8-oxo-dGTP pyrophosphatase MutT (NUDIX family) n=1 Tax=Rhizobium leguminosarum TaxID=384 RepID=A0AAE2MMF3_RHILE|nr:MULTISPECIES: NUDIX hydrolase [Rhizobium]MBB4291996.1 8-oxo-dGTP pyrophosphatase MutT (NUDIX family) [Rhizobium leguminosarum]MBB4310066.1 8-oxo-dGTP pyrophosphatase MutT (NUDIX family) [Rhizobium leguminosarum]MBB4419193.1 8-oxo-dGTP pyrophosphatase MutT (NUDIX family) [Rhizobium leguminosarum]MBB4433996.1 8-oxo-dGTP pyrophosphatase MutT (NUDIX family) [Rhizobium esperanzae]MBB4531224.1 8-oxo-dGTP pyrophosphatase MutT (NUDIX family) [Rhizobium leguminosarum]